ncbi:MAG: acetyl-CoA C-acetyltransferase [Acidobacteriaceae bacterium]
MLNVRDIAIVNGARTPMGEYCGKLRDFTAQELGAIAGIEAMKRSGVEPGEIEHVVYGNAQQTSGDALYGARHVVLKAGIPQEVPALTVNRLCGSGMQAIVSAAQMVQLGEAKTVLAGGMEAMSQAPHVIRGMRWGHPGLGGGKLEDSLLVALLDSQCGLYMAQTAEKYGAQHGITREQQDQFALESQQKAAKAAEKLAEEIVPVELRDRKGNPSGEKFAADDHGRADTTLAGLAKLRPAFGKEGTVTAGNASGIVDGGSAVVLMPLQEAQKKNLKPMGRIVSWGIAGVDPSIMGQGPVPATRKALASAGMKLDDIDLIELNEAFAAQALAVQKELGIDPKKLNVNGGAIALGHPLGSTGTRLVLTLLYELQRSKKKYGLATACIGGGQGIAMIVESLA